MTADELYKLHLALSQLRDEINTGAEDRYGTSAKSHLAEADAEVFGRAAMVAHRIHLWAKYPQVSPESYFSAPVVSDPDAWAAVAAGAKASEPEWNR